VFPIHVPALRERPDDIPALAAHFLDELGKREGATKAFSPRALMEMRAHGWQGNVRELRNIVQRAYVMAGDTVIDDPCLPVPGGAGARGETQSPRSAVPTMTFEVGTSLAEIERQVTLTTLEHFGRHKERTAAALGVSLKTLYNRLKEYAATPAHQNDGRT